jgi:hypothetical protein
MLLKELGALFPESDIEWRVGQSGIYQGNIWVKCLAYITNRAIMDRLDAVCGIENWKNEFKEWHGTSQLCGISIRIGEEWVTKWDGADNTNIEGTKGGLSDSMKRAAVQYGIGRYLYKLPESYGIVYNDKSGRYRAKVKDPTTNRDVWFSWSPPKMPDEFILKNKE